MNRQRNPVSSRWAWLSRVGVLALTLPLNGLLGAFAWHISLDVFDTLVTHYSPACALPQWKATPFMLPAYLLLGGIVAMSSRDWWAVGPPVLLSYFTALAGAHFGADYYPETVWDELGRPTDAQIAIGVLCAASTLCGWWLVRQWKVRLVGIPKVGTTRA